MSLRTNPAVVFNWQTNLTTGITTYQSKVKVSLAYPANLRNDDDATDPDSYQYYITNTINPARVTQGLAPITILPAPNFQEPSATFDRILPINCWKMGFEDITVSPVPLPSISMYCMSLFPMPIFLLTVPSAQLATLSSNATV